MAKPSYNLDWTEISFILTRLSFADNFDSFIVVNQILLPGVETAVSYTLPNRQIAKYYFSLGQSGNGLITKGTSAWTINTLYLYNNGSESVTISLVVLGN